MPSLARTPSGAILARDPGGATATQAPPEGEHESGQQDDGGAPLFGETAERNALAIRNRANMRLGSLSTFNTTAENAFSAWEPKRDRMATRYRAAFREHERVLQAGRAAAEDQNFYTGIVIGAAASVVIAAGVAIALPSVAAAAPFTGTWWLSTAGQAAASSIGGSVVGSRTGASTSGYDAAGTSEDEMVRALREMYELQRRARRVGALGPHLGIFASNGEYAVSQVNQHTHGGDKDMEWADVLDLVSELMEQEHEADGIERELIGFERLLSTAEGWEPPSQARLEQNIWITWIGSVSDSDILDRDAIENHLHAIGVLGPGSRLAVDFEGWTSKEDEEAAIRAAQGARSQLQQQRRSQPSTR